MDGQDSRKPGTGRPSAARPFVKRAGQERRPPRVGSYGRPAGGDKPAFEKEPGRGGRFARPAPQRRPGPAEARPAVPGMSADARRAALTVLNRVLIDEGFASLSLDEQFRGTPLSPRDKRLATALVYTTLENLLKLDFALDRFLKERDSLEPRVLNLLRMSACQLLLMDRLPDFAAVNEAVNLTRAMGLEPMTGLVNGVLRSVVREKDSIPWPGEGEPDYPRVMYSMPPWLMERLREGYGEETAMKIASYRKPRHDITIRRNSLRMDEKAFQAMLEKKVWQTAPGLLPDVYHVSGASSIAGDSDFLEGAYSIQGEGSMMAALALSPGIGARVLDACAAPGGKTALMAEIMQNTGRIHAWDVHEHRIGLLEAQMERLRIYNVRPAVRDACVHQERFDGEMDAVLIDAPCSGSGVMAEKPDVKYRLNAQGLAALTEIQRRLLAACAPYVKPGGILVYATCSLLPEENERQVERFLEERPEFAPDLLPESIPERLRELAGPHGLQLLPHRDGTEGFFIARMRRT